jgi:metal-responsive CopG/Arc/MetJ family transcriptional regulator
MSKYNIMTVLVNHRRDCAKDVQLLLTEYGCNIRVRLGLHEAVNVCSEDGLLILQLVGDSENIHALLNKLNDLDGVQAKLTTFAGDE